MALDFFFNCICWMVAFQKRGFKPPVERLICRTWPGRFLAYARPFSICLPNEAGLTLLLKKKNNSPPSSKSAVKITLDCLVSASWTISSFVTFNIGLTWFAGRKSPGVEHIVFRWCIESLLLSSSTQTPACGTANLGGGLHWGTLLFWQKHPPKADNSCVKYSGL